MRIVIDLQCCQTAARNRGMGRYSLSLARAMAQVAGDRDQILFGLNAKYPEEARSIVEEFDDISSPARFFFFDYPAVEAAGDERPVRENIASILRADRIATLSPDIFHISSLYEGESVYGRCPAPKALPSAPSMLRSVTLYDLIPLIFPDQYLMSSGYRSWFENTTDVLKSADLLLAISESARQDAVVRLGIPAGQIANISGAVSDIFVPMEMSAAEREGLLQKFGVSKPFIFYVGGPDIRKNMTGLMDGFGKVPAELRRNYQLVIGYHATPDEREKIAVAARRAGVQKNVVLTGFISDKDLAALYNLCDLFLFPSLYEGFGLPVLEAMSCGAATIASNVSSIPEILPRKDCLFDPRDADDIGRVTTSVLGDEDFRQSLRRYSAERAKEFSWTRSATLALEAFVDAHNAKAQRTKSIVHGKAKPKLAYFSPLPPAKSGISAYSMELLPYLADHFEIDAYVDDHSSKASVRGASAVREHVLYPQQAETYFATLYQVGNSHFHHYMRPYMRHYPGVATLHDAFIGHLGHDPGAEVEFCNLVVQMHGGEARKILMASGNLEQAAHAAIRQLTCSRLFVEQSLGVITHSRFAKGLLEATASLKIAPGFRVIPQLRKAEQPSDESSRFTARNKLSLGRDGIYAATFGHLASTKSIVQVVNAFHASSVGSGLNNRLLLVGELEGGPYGRRVREAIAAGPAASRISVTGFVDDATYKLHLEAADFAVQLRQLSRGETSRAMLDVLARGLPLITNKLGATGEFSERVAYMIADTDAYSIVHAFDELAGSENLRMVLSAAGHAFVRNELDPSRVAQRYAETIHEFVGRANQCGRARVIEAVAGQLAEQQTDQALLEAASESYIAQKISELPSRLLIDVTHIRQADLGTGVQRVVKEFTKHLYQLDMNGVEPQAIALANDRLHYADDFAQNIGARHVAEAATGRSDPIDIRPFDRMLLIDGSWHLADEFRSHLDRLRAKSGSLYPLVYDIIPLQMPQFCLDFVPPSLKRWLHIVVERASGLVSTTRAGADDLIAYIDQNRLPHLPGLRIGVCPLGADFRAMNEAQDGEANAKVASLLNGKNVFAMVGTIEPRKNHVTVLDAFEILWENDFDATLLVVGKTGWMVDDLVQRLNNHKELGRRLYRMGFVSDTDLTAIYREASGVIMASHAEGFGLPIFEAAHHRTPLILSDISVFREVAGDYGTYFPVTDADALAELLRGWSGRRADREAAMRPLTWSESTTIFRDFIFGRHTYYRFQ